MSEASVSTLTEHAKKTNYPTNGTFQVFLQNPNFYKYLDVNDLTIICNKAEDNPFMRTDCKVVSKKQVQQLNHLPEADRKYNMIAVDGPPMRVEYATTHACGTYRSNWTEGRGLETVQLPNATFSLSLSEGDIPPDVLEKYPEIERDQKEFLALLETAQRLLTKEMFDNSIVRAKEKEARRMKSIKSVRRDFKGLTDEEILKNPKALEMIYQDELDDFIENANQGTKGPCPLVRPPLAPVHKARYITIKKNICANYKKGEGLRKEIGTFKDGEIHYIDALLRCNPPKKYIPPVIYYKSKKYDLGLNEKRNLKQGDMVVPKFMFKIYDTGSYGVRLLYLSCSIFKLGPPEEENQSVPNFSIYDDDDDQMDLLDRTIILPNKSRVKSELSDTSIFKTAELLNNEQDDKQDILLPIQTEVKSENTPESQDKYKKEKEEYHEDTVEEDIIEPKKRFSESSGNINKKKKKKTNYNADVMGI